MAHEVKIIQLSGRTPEADEGRLQELAAEGWELVQIDPQPASRWYYLRRDKPAPAQYIAQFTPEPAPPDVEPPTPAPARPTWKWLLGIGDKNA